MVSQNSQKQSKPRKSANLCAKTVKREEAYEVWQTPDGSWTWYVLKKWQSPEQEAKNQYARWYCNVVTPMTSERGDTGDVYVSEIKSCAVKLDYNPLTQPKKEEAQSQFVPDPEPSIVAIFVDLPIETDNLN